MIEKSNIIDLKTQSIDTKYCIFEFETTGLDVSKDKIIEIGAVKMKNGEIVDTFSEYVNPKEHISEIVSKINNITDEMLKNAKTIEEVLPIFFEFIDDSILVSHGEDYDFKFLIYNLEKLGLKCENKYIDSLKLAREKFPEFKFYSLKKLATRFNIDISENNRAVDNAKALALVFNEMLSKLEGEL